jgi:hypothetical protein
MCVAGFWLLFACFSAVHAADYEPDIQAFAADAQRTYQKAGTFISVCWFPVEFWEATYAADPPLSKEQTKELLDAIRPYVMVVVVVSQPGALGNMTYKSEAEIRKEIKVVDGKGNVYEPLGEEDIPDNTKRFVNWFRPALGSTLGPTGKNMQLMLFRDKGGNSERLADPKSKGSFKVVLGKQEFRWKLPLASVVPPRDCTKCKEKCSGNWDYCPWCGNQLDKKS